MTPLDRKVWLPDRRLSLRVRSWPGGRRAIVLLHGLASNCLTWESVARELSEAGHAVHSVDQRGHGQSDKPARGYALGSYVTDLRSLLKVLRVPSPLIVGQSWGGTVAIDFAMRHPDSLAALALVDGGFTDMQAVPGSTWEGMAEILKPPDLTGIPRESLKRELAKAHPEWSDEGIENTLGNFETLPDGTVRPWLSLDRHMAILRSLWEYRVSENACCIRTPTLIAAAETTGSPFAETKRDAVYRMADALENCRLRWFAKTDHDIHVHRPRQLAEWILAAFSDGFLPS